MCEYRDMYTNKIFSLKCAILETRLQKYNLNLTLLYKLHILS